MKKMVVVLSVVLALVVVSIGVVAIARSHLAEQSKVYNGLDCITRVDVSKDLYDQTGQLPVFKRCLFGCDWKWDYYQAGELQYTVEIVENSVGCVVMR